MRVPGALLLTGVLVATAVVVFRAPSFLWPSLSPEDAVAELRALFPDLARLRVTALYDAGDCELLVYARGAFTTAPGTEACSLMMDVGPERRLPFDAQARTDLDGLYRRSEQAGRRIRSAFPEYDPGGAIEGGSFGFEVHRDYLYEPGHGPVPRPDSVYSYTGIDQDWYRADW